MTRLPSKEMLWKTRNCSYVRMKGLHHHDDDGDNNGYDEVVAADAECRLNRKSPAKIFSVPLCIETKAASQPESTSRLHKRF